MISCGTAVGRNSLVDLRDAKNAEIWLGKSLSGIDATY
jgi:hypothetical protein